MLERWRQAEKKEMRESRQRKIGRDRRGSKTGRLGRENERGK